MSKPTNMYRGLPGQKPEVYFMSLVATPAGGLVKPRMLRPRNELAWLPETVRFAWGNADKAGLHALAVALLADALGDERKAVALSLSFAEQFLARIPAFEPWIITDNVVRSIAANLAKEPVPA